MRIVFLGVGALGSTTAVLCRALDASFALVDFDKVESKNLSSQAFVKQSLGKNKAEALKAQLLNFYGLKVDAFGVRLTAENIVQLLDGAGLVVDCFDNAASRKIVSEHARAKGLPLVHAAISGDGSFGIVRWDAHFVPDAEDHAGQATCEGGEHLPMIGLLAATLARTIQDFVARQEQRDSMVGLKSVTVTS
ncbi:MAG: ThiF family adenylyltransferase [Myxococcaceae bacterium]|nr:ThiF family adenylyltransferase [Myxococcaceae bacterium]